MKFKFKKIPEQSKFAAFDLNQEGSAELHEISLGDSEIDFDIPSDWKRPHYAIRTKRYYIQDSYVPIVDAEKPITISGADYYIDVTREGVEVEENWKSVEGLIVAISSSSLEPRQNSSPVCCH